MVRMSNPLSDADPHVAPKFARSALVVIDTQVDFLDGGARPIAGTTQVLPSIGRLLAAYREAGRPIVRCSAAKPPRPWPVPLPGPSVSSVPFKS